VGFGKTEVAIRAAFKAAQDGKQTVVLVPTTVLAFQHNQTFKKRFADTAVRVEMLSRFVSPAQSKKVLADLAAGKIDVIIGTHRLLSKDFVVKDLGLLIVDEEQRFGVTHKEKIKKFKAQVDVLSMSATPIPRTLNMGLMGVSLGSGGERTRKRG
jgi:transcription-repair coupling factor (superfamily II helicase)